VTSSLVTGVDARPETNLAHYKAVRKPLVAIILNILSAMLRLRLRNDLYCVEWGVKLYSLTHSCFTVERSKFSIS